jgi:transposase
VKPHHSRYWLTPNHDNEEIFVAEVKEVCKTYHEAPEKAATNNRRTISIDENTGIQALERKNPTKMIEPGKPERIEFEYIRHGTLSLIANFDVVTGKIVSPGIGETRNEYDFCEHIRNLILSDPEAQEWVFVTDQLNTHQSESLVRLVGELCGIKDDLGVKGKKGILKSMKSRAEFLKMKEHAIRFVYTPKHCSWLNQVEIWFSILTKKIIKRGNFTSKEDLKRKLLDFICYFNATMAKPYKWTFNGLPLKA